MYNKYNITRLLHLDSCSRCVIYFCYLLKNLHNQQKQLRWVSIYIVYVKNNMVMDYFNEL